MQLVAIQRPIMGGAAALVGNTHGRYFVDWAPRPCGGECAPQADGDLSFPTRGVVVFVGADPLPFSPLGHLHKSDGDLIVSPFSVHSRDPQTNLLRVATSLVSIGLGTGSVLSHARSPYPPSSGLNPSQLPTPRWIEFCNVRPDRTLKLMLIPDPSADKHVRGSLIR